MAPRRLAYDGYRPALAAAPPGNESNRP
jgi:hypothetical protein